MYDLFVLSNEPVNDWYPEYHKKKSHKRTVFNRDEISRDLWPEWERQWTDSERTTTELFEKYATHSFQNIDIMNTYWLFSRQKFRVLERLDRVKKRLDFNTSDSLKRKIKDDLRTDKRRRVDINVQPAQSLSNQRKRKNEPKNTRSETKRQRTIGLSLIHI